MSISYFYTIKALDENLNDQEVTFKIGGKTEIKKLFYCKTGFSTKEEADQHAQKTALMIPTSLSKQPFFIEVCALEN